jgi:hypothetical protein
LVVFSGLDPRSDEPPGVGCFPHLQVRWQKVPVKGKKFLGVVAGAVVWWENIASLCFTRVFIRS